MFFVLPSFGWGRTQSIKSHETGKKHLETVAQSKKDKRDAERGSALDEADLQRQVGNRLPSL